MAHEPDRMLRTRATLLARLKDIDDHKSWTEFYNIYSRLIFGIAIQRGLSPHEADDVVVETIASAAKHMPGFQYDRKLGSFKSWLLQMARWRIVDQYKKRQRQVVEFHPDLTKPDSTTETPLSSMPTGCDLEKIWDEEWETCLMNRATEKAKRQLNPKHYQIFDLYVRKQWSPEKVAEFLSVNVSQVYLAKHRVGEAIKKEIERLREEII